MKVYRPFSAFAVDHKGDPVPVNGLLFDRPELKGWRVELRAKYFSSTNLCVWLNEDQRVSLGSVDGSSSIVIGGTDATVTVYMRSINENIMFVQFTCSDDPGYMVHRKYLFIRRGGEELIDVFLRHCPHLETRFDELRAEGYRFRYDDNTEFCDTETGQLLKPLTLYHCFKDPVTIEPPPGTRHAGHADCLGFSRHELKELWGELPGVTWNITSKGGCINYLEELVIGNAELSKTVKLWEYDDLYRLRFQGHGFLPVTEPEPECEVLASEIVTDTITVPEISE